MEKLAIAQIDPLTHHQPIDAQEKFEDDQIT